MWTREKEESVDVFISTIGWIKETTPIINNILAILDPITFPITISLKPKLIDWREAASSGRLVPPATITTPIIKGDTLKIWAKLTAPPN